MSANRDYYELLGVDRSASADDIKSAYRKLAREYHPDVSDDTDAEVRFKEINEAYQVLSDPEKKATYDRFGRVEPGGFGFDFGFRDPFEIFEEVFGGLGGFGFRTARQGGPRRGRDLRYDLKLTFEEAAFGCQREIEVAGLDSCPQCQGTGAEPGTNPVRCTECNGSGQVRQVQRSILGSFVNVATCPTCRGIGETIPIPCTNCQGRGRIRSTRRLQVNIPPGVDTGTKVRLAGEGEPGERGGPAGNLYVVLDVEPHPYFRRRGDDIIIEVNINVAQAALGTRIPVPTLEGEESIDIRPGTQPGAVVRLRGKGIQHLKRNGRGDQLVLIRVEVPSKLSREQRDLFEDLGTTLGSESIVEIEEPTLLDRIREALGL
jgi:molecular chaperone DnaJ